MSGLFRRNPGFGRLIGGQVPADFADWLAYVAMVSLLAYEWEAPTVAFAWFGVALGLPYLTVGLLAGPGGSWARPSPPGPRAGRRRRSGPWGWPG